MRIYIQAKMHSVEGKNISDLPLLPLHCINHMHTLMKYLKVLQYLTLKEDDPRYLCIQENQTKAQSLVSSLHKAH